MNAGRNHIKEAATAPSDNLLPKIMQRHPMIPPTGICTRGPDKLHRYACPKRPKSSIIPYQWVVNLDGIVQMEKYISIMLKGVSHDQKGEPAPGRSGPGVEAMGVPATVTGLAAPASRKVSLCFFEPLSNGQSLLILCQQGYTRGEKDTKGVYMFSRRGGRKKRFWRTFCWS